jgi:hypothetical protein
VWRGAEEDQAAVAFAADRLKYKRQRDNVTCRDEFNRFLIAPPNVLPEDARRPGEITSVYPAGYQQDFRELSKRRAEGLR